MQDAAQRLFATARATASESGYDLADQDLQQLGSYLNLLEHLRRQGRTGQALELCRQALPLFEEHPALGFALAILLQQNGALGEAAERFEQLRQQDYDLQRILPPYFELVATQLGHYAKGVELADQLLAIDPNNLPILRQLMKLRFILNQQDQAQKLAQRILVQDPENALALAILVSSHYRQQQEDKAESYIERYLEHFPAGHDAEADLILFNIQTQLCRPRTDWDETWLARRLADLPANDLSNNLSLLSVRSISDTPVGLQQYLGLQQLWGQKITQLARQQPIRVQKGQTYPPAVSEKPHLGFITVLFIPKLAEVLAPIFELLRADFRISLFSIAADEPSMQRLRGAFDQVVDQHILIPHFQNDLIAKVIAETGTDILVDLNGLQQPSSKVGVFGYRLAPLQLIWAGIPTPCVFDAVDCQILDPYLVSREAPAQGPRPLLLPEAWSNFGEPPELAIESAPTDQPERLGVMVTSDKLRSMMIATWAGLLKRRPEANLWFTRPDYAGPRVQHNLLAQFAAHGIAADRICFDAGLATGESHLKLYNRMHLNLDAYPLNSGITILEAAWMGRPSISLRGPLMHQRIGYSVLGNLGLAEECVAENPDDYIDKALSLLNSQQRQQELRQTLRSRLKSTVLYDRRRFARHLSATLANLWRQFNSKG